MIKIDADMRRKLKKPWLWVVIVLASAAVWIIGFYWASRTPSKLVFEIWVGAEFTLSDDLQDSVGQICRDNGMRECKIRNYNPEDYYYGAAFGLQSRSVDVYILSRDEALTTAQAGIFLVLGEEYTTDLQTVSYENDIIGVKFTEDYYIFVNVTSKKSVKLLSTVVREIATYGE